MQAQFVREYNAGPTANLVFTCIAKAQSGNYFIAGLQDTSIYLSEVTATGNVVREKLIGVGNVYYRLTSMIVDGDGNIVIVGLWRNTTGILHAYLMKVSPALSVISHITYNNKLTTDGMAFTDVKDYKTTGPNNAYYITGYTYGAAGWNSLLMKLDRSTGAILAIYNGRPTAAAANTAQDNYASLLLDTAVTAASPGGIFVTAPLNSGSGASNRPWLVKHNISTLAFNSGERYLRDVQASQTASLYNISIAKDTSNLLYCWYGSPNVTSNNTHTAMGLTKVVEGTLAPVWQKAYKLTPASPSPFKYNALTKVANDANGYLTEGVWTDGASESGGDIFFIRTNKNGIPQWARQYKNVSSVQSFNSNFIIDGGNIFAVGFRTNSGNKKGILIVAPLSTGSMDTACASPLTVQTSDSTYAKGDNLQTLQAGITPQPNYYPVNCTATTGVVPCNGCRANTITLDANFTLNGQLVGNLTTFTLTASAYSTANNSQFIVSRVDPTLPGYPDVAGSVLSVSTWGGPGTTTVFPFYQGTSVQGTNATGIFNAGSIYRVRHILSGFNNCGILKADTISKLVLLAPGLKAGSNGINNFMIIGEGNTPTPDVSLMLKNLQASIFVTNTGKAALFPSPANAYVILNTEAITEKNTAFKVVNSAGVVLSSGKMGGTKQLSVDTHAWANGMYLYNILTSDGQVIAKGKFVVQH